MTTSKKPATKKLTLLRLKEKNRRLTSLLNLREAELDAAKRQLRQLLEYRRRAKRLSWST